MRDWVGLIKINLQVWNYVQKEKQNYRLLREHQGLKLKAIYPKLKTKAFIDNEEKTWCRIHQFWDKYLISNSYRILSTNIVEKIKKDSRVVRLRILHAFSLEWIGWNRITFVINASFSLMSEGLSKLLLGL